jgi:hypothetical protein
MEGPKVRMRAAAWLLCMAGCSAMPVSALIRSPVDSKCRSYGLKGCPELVDGTIAYAEGDKALAMQKLEEARALNTPEQLKPFAEALRSLGKTGPGAAAPLVAVADLLVPATSSSMAGSAVASAPIPTERTVATAQRGTPQAAEPEPILPTTPKNGDPNAQLIMLALTAPIDPLRMITKTVTIKGTEGNCDVVGDSSTCERQQEGPVIVTDVVASAGCGDRAFLLASLSDSTSLGQAWVVPAVTTGIDGARLVVKPGEWLHVGARRADKTSTAKGACFVTWSWYRPRLVPVKLWD